MVSLVPPSLAGSAQVAPARDGDASPAPRPKTKAASAGRRPAPAPADDDYAKALEQRPGDESLVFWRRTKREPSCMDLEPFGKIRNEVKRKHDQRVAEAAAAARKAREARGAAPSPDRPTARAAVARAVELLPDEAALSLEAPPWLRDRFRRCGACLGHARDDDVPDDAALTPARRRKRFEAGDAAGCAAARTAARGAVAAACDVFARAAFPGAPAAAARRAVDDVERALDDELRGGGRRAAEALDALEARAVALARWRLVRDGVPLLVERRWRLAPPTKAATAAYRAGLLPRAFAGRARANGGAAMRPGDWRGFLEDAGVLGNGGPRALGELKADLIFTSLARDADGDDARGDKVLNVRP